MRSSNKAASSPSFMEDCLLPNWSPLMKGHWKVIISWNLTEINWIWWNSLNPQKFGYFLNLLAFSPGQHQGFNIIFGKRPNGRVSWLFQAGKPKRSAQMCGCNGKSWEFALLSSVAPPTPYQTSWRTILAMSHHTKTCEKKHVTLNWRYFVQRVGAEKLFTR